MIRYIEVSSMSQLSAEEHIMKRSWVLVVYLAILCVTAGAAGQPGSFSQAQQLSAQTGKPILLEFVHED